MLVLGAVRHAYAPRLKASSGGRFAFQVVETWEDAVDAIRTQPIEIVVVDPALEARRPRAHEIERVGVLFPSIPRIVYTSLTPETGPILLRLGRAGVRDMIVAGCDDHPTRITEVLLSVAARAVSHRLIDALDDVLGGCPGELRWAMETLIREPARLHSVGALAERSRMDRRTCARWFTRAGLPPPSTMLMIFRIVYAHRLLQDPGFTVEDVAMKLGYTKVRSFTQHTKEIFGLTAGEARVSLTPEDAVVLVRERYFRRAAQKVKIVS